MNLVRLEAWGARCRFGEGGHRSTGKVEAAPKCVCQALKNASGEWSSRSAETEAKCVERRGRENAFGVGLEAWELDVGSG